MNKSRIRTEKTGDPKIVFLFKPDLFTKYAFFLGKDQDMARKGTGERRDAR
jgi:hypothetical protein